MILQKKNFNPFGSNINIDIHRSLKSKSITIMIHKDCIKINAPFFLNNAKINELLKKKFHWIKKKLIIQKNIQLPIKKEYINGEEFKYLGKTYLLQIVKGIKYSVIIEDNLLIVTVKNITNIIKIKRLVNKWFYEKSNTYFKEKTFYHAKENKLNVSEVKIREYKSRWGSCSTDCIISFNWRLIMAPPNIIEYVIIHELMHLKEHNHSPKYWGHVKLLYPNIEEAKNWLIYNGKTLTIN